MAKRIIAIAIALGLVASLVGCASQEQVDCEESGGVWTSHFEGFIQVSTGKTIILVPVYSYTCEPSGSGSAS